MHQALRLKRSKWQPLLRAGHGMLNNVSKMQVESFVVFSQACRPVPKQCSLPGRAPVCTARRRAASPG